MINRFPLIGVLLAGLVISQSVGAAERGVLPPAQGSTNNICYEECMHHYAQFDGYVESSTAAWCAKSCHYAPVKTTQDPACAAACTDQYHACMKTSPDPANDRNCPVSYFPCLDQCWR